MHNFLPYDVPPYVLSFLSKGSKFVPDTFKSHCANVRAMRGPVARGARVMGWMRADVYVLESGHKIVPIPHQP